MFVRALKTHIIQPQESIESILDAYLPQLTENSILALASKIVSTCEGNIVSKTIDKMELVHQEADYCFVAPNMAPSFCLTKKNGRLIPNAGLDESNVHDAYVLLPKAPQASAAYIWHYVRQRQQIQNFGVIITDSNVTPLRRGVVGIGLGWCGFKPIYDYCGQVDIFQRPMQVTQINLLDSLATAATLCMGEGNEQAPLALLQDVPHITFQQRIPNAQEESVVIINEHEDLFGVLSAIPAL